MPGFAHVSHGSYSGAPLPTGLLVGVGTLLVLAALVSAAGYTALEISPDNRRYRTYFGLLGLKLGSWQPLPPVVGVTLKYFSTLGSGPAPGATSWGTWDSSAVRTHKLVVLLSLQHSATGLVIGRFSADAREPARQLAQQTAARFGVPLREYLAPAPSRRR